ncbi:hypothetical protein ACIRL3_23785 [Streptomyces sp. NPDC102384]|uniref:hypothetical protein n=1 Tax=Streptomyces sp. NPDC102384 TaxID=3366166 RepID=UPI0038054158
MADAHPHITIGHHAQYGVVAATSHDHPVTEHMLGRVGFERLPGSTLYALTAPHHDPVRRGGQAVQSLRAAQFTVTSDAAYDLQPTTRPSPVTHRRRVQAATAVSPARSDTAPHRRPALVAEHSPAPAPALPTRAR